MKIIIDDKIPYIRGVFEPFAEVHYLSGAATTPEIAHNADALITRTRTICNQKLLENSTVKFIATATIGYDHIDTEWCKSAGIEWTNAPGCNSSSVEQYVLAAILYQAREKGLILKGKTLGVVGVGNVGSKVARVGQLLGMKVLLNDPPRERAEGEGIFTSLDHILEEADIITLHVPLQHEGTDKTF
ncbi:MAG: NAD(P)-dependent oxidoreductase, partial [Bacteroidota bacterium]|nr:NAD(P)-dependent oxidoreductase [Bacteroidota bacterium]